MNTTGHVAFFPHSMLWLIVHFRHPPVKGSWIVFIIKKVTLSLALQYYITLLYIVYLSLLLLLLLLLLKAVPLQTWSGPEGSRKLRFPDYVTTAQDGGKDVSLTHRPPLPPRKYSWYSFLLEAESTPGP